MIYLRYYTQFMVMCFYVTICYSISTGEQNKLTTTTGDLPNELRFTIHSEYTKPIVINCMLLFNGILARYIAKGYSVKEKDRIKYLQIAKKLVKDVDTVKYPIDITENDELIIHLKEIEKMGLFQSSKLIYIFIYIYNIYIYIIYIYIYIIGAFEYLKRRFKMLRSSKEFTLQRYNNIEMGEHLLFYLIQYLEYPLKWEDSLKDCYKAGMRFLFRGCYRRLQLTEDKYERNLQDCIDEGLEARNEKNEK
eukprot:GHVL01013151.1.p1 GENE.GHVL01013151.1~~GHVL01013151.1.p1  ORF type:complete len:249 (+),score=12.07 GHVL01013151.1:72-818(+)